MCGGTYTICICVCTYIYLHEYTPTYIVCATHVTTSHMCGAATHARRSAAHMMAIALATCVLNMLFKGKRSHRGARAALRWYHRQRRRARNATPVVPDPQTATSSSPSSSSMSSSQSSIVASVVAVSPPVDPSSGCPVEPPYLPVTPSPPLPSPPIIPRSPLHPPPAASPSLREGEVRDSDETADGGTAMSGPWDAMCSSTMIEMQMRWRARACSRGGGRAGASMLARLATHTLYVCIRIRACIHICTCI